MKQQTFVFLCRDGTLFKHNLCLGVSMYKTYLFRKYPNSIQSHLIHQTFGSGGLPYL